MGASPVHVTEYAALCSRKWHFREWFIDVILIAQSFETRRLKP